MKILITGATGFIGREVGKKLSLQGHEIWALTREAQKARLELPYPAQVIEGDLTRAPLADSGALRGIDAVIHLAGENVGEGRWTPERKERILRSRVDFTKHLLQSLPPTLKVFVSASAIGIYGDRQDEELTESSSSGEGFLAEVCRQWEGAVQEAEAKFPHTRFVTLRTAVVLSPFGGALTKMLKPFQMGLGAKLASGQQWMSWIHLQDLVSLYVKACEDEKFSGVYNAVAPTPARNEDFTKSLCQALQVSQAPAVPEVALKLLFGEMSQVLLASQKVKSSRLADFSFEYPTLSQALETTGKLYCDSQQVFYAEQFFPLPRAEVFSFFMKAENLEMITPPLLNFQIQSVSTPVMQEGTLIDYRLKVHGLPLHWRTLIEDWNPDESFTDLQLKGPYQLWRHTHRFQEMAGGTLMTDLVRYRLPLGKLGEVFGGAFVRGDVQKIFAYRQKTVPQLIQAEGRG